MLLDTRSRPGAKHLVGAFARDSLYRNSSFLMLNSAIAATLGFVFWALASHAFSAGTVGEVSVVVGALTFAVAAGTLGLPNTLIRFLAAERDPTRLLATAGAVVLGFGGLVGIAWCAVPGYLGVPLASVAPPPLMVPIVAAATAVGAVGVLAQSAIIAMRKCQWVVVENAAGSVAKLVVLPLAIGLGASGLFGLYLVGLLVSTVVSIVILARRLGSVGRRWRGVLELGVLRRCATYAAGNHVAALLAMLPTAALPIVVLDRLGARQAAYFAMPLMIVGLLNVIPSMAGQSLFAEAAADETSLRAQTRKTLAGVYTLMIPAIAVLVVFATPILSIFGSDYARVGAPCLRLLAISGLWAGFNYVADVVLNARKHVRGYVFLNAAGTACAVVFPIAGLGHGLTGVGVGWLVGQVGYSLLAAATLASVRTARVTLRPVTSG